jgi:xanthine dehydrogenase molybdenum-binding subunit
MSAHENDTRYIGRSAPRRDALRKVIGAEQYVQDLRVPGMLVGKILRAGVPHARIRAIDVSRARALPGVYAVITAADAPPGRLGVNRDHPILKADRVRSERDELAAVAAIDEDTAREALALVAVELEPLPPLLDPFEALREGAPLVHDDRPGNVALRYAHVHGDVDAALAASDVVVEGRFVLPRIAHACLGTFGCLAQWDLEGRLSLTTPTQVPNLALHDLSKILGLPPQKIRIVQPAIGGGFGSKLDVYPHEPIAALLARAAGRPVKIVFDRREEFVASPTRQDSVIDLKTGARRDGTLTARDCRVVLDNGGYTSWGATIPMVMMEAISSLYRLEAVRFEAVAAYTNNPYAGAFRGYGNPQGTFAVESQMDELAAALGVDPLDLRLKNAQAPGEVTPQGLRLTTCGLRDCLLQAAEGIGWQDRRRGQAPGEGHRRRGVGLASMIHVAGGARIYGSDGCGSILKIDDFGRVTLITGATDIGQGAEEILATIVAEELGVEPAAVSVVGNDTDVAPWDVGVHASRTTFIAGNSARLAAQKLKQRLAEAASEVWGVPVEKLEVGGGTVRVRTAPDKPPIAYDRLVRQVHFRPKSTQLVAEAFYEPPSVHQDANFVGNVSATYGFATHAAEVEVDTETGKVTVLRMVCAHDVGRALSPTAVVGQVEGGVAQGLGYAVMEELLVQGGKIANPSFVDYHIPKATDVPPIDVRLVETDDRDGPFGAKGMAEAPIIPVAAAVANAVADALGVRLRQLPMTPERVLAALGRAECTDT